MTAEEKLRSGDYCKCGACGHEGHVYGVPAPWCQRCGVNSKLTKVDRPNS